MRRKLFTHYFPSGNNVDVYIEGDAKPTGLKFATFEWEYYPPSKRDHARYLRDVVPRLELEYARMFGDGKPLLQPGESLYVQVAEPDDAA